MHVLHVIDGLGLGGAERMLVDIANCSARDGHRVSVCVTRHDTTLQSELDPRIRVLVLGRTRRISPRAVAALARYIRETGVEVIHAHMRSNMQFVLQLRLTRAGRVPVVFHDHYGTIEVDRTIPWWFRIGHRFIAQYVGVYASLADWARQAGMSGARVMTIPNALDLTRLAGAETHDLRAELDMPADRPLALVVANLRRDKALEVLLDACVELRGKLVVAIAGPDNELDYVAMLKRRHRELGLDDGTVRFLGARRDVPALLASVDFAIMPSRTESGPLVLIEFLAAGLAIASTRVGDVGRRLADAGVAGFVPPDDAKALARAIGELVALTPAQRAARGAHGRAVLLETFDLRRTMPTWYRLYAQVIAEAAA